MRPAPSLLAALLLALTLASCVVHLGSCSRSGYVRGSGVRVDQERALEEFDRITLSGAFQLVARAGHEQRVVLRGDDNLLEHVRTRVRGGLLEVDTPGASLSSDRPIEVEVSAPQLSALTISGSTRFELHDLEAERFALKVSGSANGRATGRVEALRVDISGSARVDFFELAAREVDLAISGSGRVDVHAEQRLDSSISGSGQVRYRGQPAVTTRASGSASVRSAPM